MREDERLYFDWLCRKVDAGPDTHYRDRHSLLYFLFTKEYSWTLMMDENRAMDGLALRCAYDYHSPKPVSCLEVMVALALRMENDIMDDPAYGDRTSQWFCEMLVSLENLYSMTDNRFDDEYACVILDRWMDNAYEPNGYGGLFTLSDCHKDVRTMEIWYQMQWYLHDK